LIFDVALFIKVDLMASLHEFTGGAPGVILSQLTGPIEKSIRW
jgi:hypothetical protein